MAIAFERLSMTRVCCDGINGNVWETKEELNAQFFFDMAAAEKKVNNTTPALR